jgi:hypothetical protein
MKTSIKFATGLILAAAALVASGSAAQAGEGGAAGSVSIKFAGTFTAVTANNVTTQVPDVSRLSTSVAVGKSFAVATAKTSGNSTSTSAIGSAGGFSISNAGTSYAATAETPANTLIDQANNFDGTAAGGTTLKPTSGVTLAD